MALTTLEDVRRFVLLRDRPGRDGMGLWISVTGPAAGEDGGPPEQYVCELVVDAVWCRGSMPLRIDQTSVDGWERVLGRLARGHEATWSVSPRGGADIRLVPHDDGHLRVTVNACDVPVELVLELTPDDDWVDDQRVLLAETRRRFPGLADPVAPSR